MEHMKIAHVAYVCFPLFKKVAYFYPKVSQLKTRLKSVSPTLNVAENALRNA